MDYQACKPACKEPWLCHKAHSAQSLLRASRQGSRNRIRSCSETRRGTLSLGKANTLLQLLLRAENGHYIRGNETILCASPKSRERDAYKPYSPPTILDHKAVQTWTDIARQHYFCKGFWINRSGPCSGPEATKLVKWSRNAERLRASEELDAMIMRELNSRPADRSSTRSWWYSKVGLRCDQ